jgi:hypothetical protein
MSHKYERRVETLNQHKKEKDPHHKRDHSVDILKNRKYSNKQKKALTNLKKKMDKSNRTWM